MALLAHKIAAFSIEHLTYLGIRAHACTPPSSGEGLTTDEVRLNPLYIVDQTLQTIFLAPTRSVFNQRYMESQR